MWHPEREPNFSDLISKELNISLGLKSGITIIFIFYLEYIRLNTGC